MIKRIVVKGLLVLSLASLVGCSNDNQDLKRPTAQEKKAIEDKYFKETNSVDETLEFLNNKSGFIIMGEVDPDQTRIDNINALKLASVQTETTVIFFNPKDHKDSSKIQSILQKRYSLQLRIKGNREESLNIHVNDLRNKLESVTFDEAVVLYSNFFNDHKDELEKP